MLVHNRGVGRKGANASAPQLKRELSQLNIDPVILAALSAFLLWSSLGFRARFPRRLSFPLVCLYTFLSLSFCIVSTFASVFPLLSFSSSLSLVFPAAAGSSLSNSRQPRESQSQSIWHPTYLHAEGFSTPSVPFGHSSGLRTIHCHEHVSRIAGKLVDWRSLPIRFLIAR